MPDPALPTREELPALVPTPDSILWRYAGDMRLMAAAGYALVLQVSHPTVGAGVREHSDYASDPYGRLLRTLDFSYVVVYGGLEAAAEIGPRLRKMHKRIQGTDPQGRRYYALEPGAYAWVHATLVEAMVSAHRRFGRPMSDEQTDRFYSQWRDVGRVIGVRETDLPPTWAGFQEYFNDMVEQQLEDNDQVSGVLEVLTRPMAPPLPGIGDRSWKVVRFPLARLGALATVGMLPPVLRSRFGLKWTRAQELELKSLAATSRAMTPVLPKRLRNSGPYYLRWREKAIARGDITAHGPGAEAIAAAA